MSAGGPLPCKQDRVRATPWRAVQRRQVTEGQPRAGQAGAGGRRSGAPATPTYCPESHRRSGGWSGSHHLAVFTGVDDDKMRHEENKCEKSACSGLRFHFPVLDLYLWPLNQVFCNYFSKHVPMLKEENSFFCIFLFIPSSHI